MLGISGCASLPDNSNRSESYAMMDVDTTALEKGLKKHYQEGVATIEFMLRSS